MIITDPVSSHITLYVMDIEPGPGTVLFADGATASGLTYTFTDLSSGADELDFSNDCEVQYNYTPVANVKGCDRTIVHIRINPKGMFGGASSRESPSFDLQFRVREN